MPPRSLGRRSRSTVGVGGSAGSSGPRRVPLLRWLVVALLLAIALLGAVAGVGALLREQDQMPARMTVIEQVIDAMNHRDVESLRSSFSADGIVEFPSVDARSGREGDVYMSDWPLDLESFPEAWMAALDKWGMEARLGSCRTQSESTDQLRSPDPLACAPGRDRRGVDLRLRRGIA